MDSGQALKENIYSYIDKELEKLRQTKAELKYKNKITIRVDGRIEALQGIKFFIQAQNREDKVSKTQVDNDNQKGYYVYGFN